MSLLRHEGRWTPEDRAAGPYRYLPFDVPPDATAVRVRLAYDGSAGVLDLGCLAPEGFRGWSGGARSTFLLGTGAATPGYLPGPLVPGTWQVLLGLHRVPPDGLPWELEVEVTRGGAPAGPGAPAFPPRPPRPPRRQLPTYDGCTWLAGDLHAHTVHSDGSLTVPELATLAAAQGLDFLAVTDHNTVSHHPELAAAGRAAGIQLVPGQEVTTASGHANAFGDIGWVDFREPGGSWWPEVARRGGLLSINHPLAGDCAWRQPVADRPPLAEVWHSSWADRRWGGPLAWWQAWGLATVPVGGSDFHRHPDQPPGSPTTWVACADEDVLGGLRAGRVAISSGPGGPLLLPTDDGRLLALGADGALLSGPQGRRRVVHGERVVLDRLDDRAAHWLEDGATQLLALTV